MSENLRLEALRFTISVFKEGCRNLWAMVSTVQPANASWSRIMNKMKVTFCNLTDLLLIHQRFCCGQYMLSGSGISLVIADIRLSSFLSLTDFYLYCALDGVVRFYVYRSCCLVQEEDFVPNRSSKLRGINARINTI